MMIKSIWRFIITLGGLLSSKVDEASDAIASSPEGIRATFRQTREQWTKQFQEVRDAVSQLMMVIEQKRDELVKLDKEEADLQTKKSGALKKYQETKDEKFKVAFGDYHKRNQEIDLRQAALSEEVGALEQQINRYKLRLTEMQGEINKLSQKEAEAIADIVSSKQIIALNDRLGGLQTNLSDANLHAIETARQKAKAKAKLSDALAGADKNEIDREVMAAGISNAAEDEFNRLLMEAEGKAKEASPATEQALRNM